MEEKTRQRLMKEEEKEDLLTGLSMLWNAILIMQDPMACIFCALILLAFIDTCLCSVLICLSFQQS